MALPEPLASVEDFERFLRTTFSAEEREQADFTLRVVSTWARTLGGRDWNTTDNLPPYDVVAVVLSAARRDWLNPQRLITESMGPISVTRARPPEGFFDPGEVQILKKKSRGSLYTINTYREDRPRLGVAFNHMSPDMGDEPYPDLNEGEPGYEDGLHL